MGGGSKMRKNDQPELTSKTIGFAKNPDNEKKQPGRLEEESIGVYKIKPLKEKVFYLDLQGYRGVSVLTNALVSLGATIETFLSKDVHYVITTRVVRKEEDEKSPAASAPSPLSVCTDSPFGAALNSMENATNSKTPAVRVKTRADLLLERARTEVSGSSDIIQTARQWGVNVLPLQRVLSWLRKIEESKGKSSIKARNEIPSPEVVDCPGFILEGPFLKIETVTRAYKPLYWQQPTWPDLFLNTLHNGSPFLQYPKSNKFRKQSKKKIKPKLQSSRKCHHRNTSNKNESPPKEITKKASPKKTGYCEICASSYSQLSKHLTGEVHRDNARNIDLYSKLDALICDGPVFEDLTATILQDSSP